jgi:hypothetical protein
MHQMKIRRFRLALLAGLLAGQSVVSALEIEPGVGAGLLYTDNATLAPSSDAEDDLIVVGYVGVRITKDSGPLLVDASVDAVHLNYINDSFDNQTFPGLNATVGWEQIKGRLNWNLQDFLTQQRVNSLDGVTPDNIQNTNVFTFGPAITFPVTDRQSVSIIPLFSDFSYEDLATDNRQYSLAANWNYQMYRTMSVGLTGDVTKVNYESGSGVPDYTRANVYITISGTGARSAYSINLGSTKTDRDDSSNIDGFTGDLTLQYQLTGRSSARVHVGSNVTDTGNILLNSQTDPQNGGFSNVQTSDETVRDSIVRFDYNRDDATLQTSAWGELRKLDYELAQSDRDVMSFGVLLDYPVTPLITASLSGTYDRIKQTDLEITDNRYSVIGTIAYNFTRKLRTSVDLRYQQQTSDISLIEYKELSSFVRLVYGFANVARPGSRGQIQ